MPARGDVARARRRRDGAHPAPLVVAGHSAGGHLAAMMYATDWRRGRASRRRRSPAASRCRACTTSRRWCCFRTTPTFASTTPKRDACRRSIARPRTDAPLVSRSAPTRRRNSCGSRSLLWDAWPRNRPAACRRRSRFAGRHHFNVVLDYTDPASALTQATARAVSFESLAGARWRARRASRLPSTATAARADAMAARFRTCGAAVKCSRPHCNGTRMQRCRSHRLSRSSPRSRPGGWSSWSTRRIARTRAISCSPPIA